jgi:tol-pal system protein YbgF
VLYKQYIIQVLCLLAGLAIPVTIMAADKRAPVSEPISADITARLDKLERLLQNQGLLDMLQQLEHLQAEINQMRGEVELQNHTLEEMKKRQRDLYTDIDRRMQRFESGTVPAPAQTGNDIPPLESLPAAGSGTIPDAAGDTTEPALTVETVEKIRPAPSATGAEALKPEKTIRPEAVQATAADTTLAPVDPARAKADYQKAFNMLKQAQYDQAIKAFNEFLAIHPDSQYADNAQYWLGEANYVMQQYETAITEYEKLITKYPDSQKATHALLKIAYSYHELGQQDEAQRRLEDLKQRYPGTTAGRLAEEKLKQIRLTPQ